jgi:hypothetical protein
MKILRRITFLLLILVLIIPSINNIIPSQTGYAAGSVPGIQNPSDTTYLYLPYITKTQAGPPLMLGIYPPGQLGPNDQAQIDLHLKAADAWAGKGHSLVGTFLDLENSNPTYNFYGMLEMLWTNGYTPFVNLNSTRTAAQIAGGAIDAKIRAMGTAYANWIALGGGRKAFLAPLPEMNGYWPSYGQDIANFKLSYDRIRNLFAQQGAPTSSAWWTFAPNGYSNNANKFENYYPGDSKVDAIGFSSYNYGWCPAAAPYEKWEDYTTLFLPYIDRMRIMAPSKPIIITQTGTTAQYPHANIFDHAKKDQWLVDNYSYLASRYGVMAIMYYDLDLSWECDWAIYNITYNGVTRYEGYKTVATDYRFTYVAPANLSAMDISVP